MRINPILKWNYKNVWDFIKLFEIPYCCLYDEGYTYLGNKINSKKNIWLKKNDGCYNPAYMCEGIYENISRLPEEIQNKIKYCKERENLIIVIVLRKQNFYLQNVKLL